MWDSNLSNSLTMYYDCVRGWVGGWARVWVGGYVNSCFLGLDSDIPKKFFLHSQSTWLVLTLLYIFSNCLFVCTSTPFTWAIIMSAAVQLYFG